MVLNANSPTEGKLAPDLGHKGTNHRIIDHWLYLNAFLGSRNTVFEGWIKTWAGLNLCACQPQKAGAGRWSLHPPVPLLSPRKARTRLQAFPLGQGLARLTSASPQFESVLSRPSLGCNIQEGGVIY